MLLDFADIFPGKMERRRRKRDRKICDKCRKTQENSVRKTEKIGKVWEEIRENSRKAEDLAEESSVQLLEGRC